MAAKAGGTSGVLWGSALEAAGAVVGDQADAYDAQVAADAVKAAYEKMLSLGGAHRGDKTMLDALIPFGEALEAAAGEGKSLGMPGLLPQKLLRRLLKIPLIWFLRLVVLVRLLSVVLVRLMQEQFLWLFAFARFFLLSKYRRRPLFITN